MKQIKIFSVIACVLFASSSVASTTWGVVDFLDPVATPATAQAVSISAWSTTGSGSTLASACIHNYLPNGYGIVNTAEITPCSGEPGTGPHAADNVGTTDLFLLQFSEAVSLTKVSIGWNGSDDYSADSDLSVLALKDGFGSSINGKTLSGLLNTVSGGWQVIGNYANVGQSNGTAPGGSADVNTPVTSSWWIVSAYNSTFGTGTNLGGGNDYFKLLSVAVSTPTPPGKVSEPAALLLMGTALFGIAGLRRRRTL